MRVGAGGGFGGGVHFFRGGLHEAVRQRLTAGGVEALQEERAGRAAGAADEVVSEDGCHVDLIQGKPRRGWPAGLEPRLRRNEGNRAAGLSWSSGLCTAVGLQSATTRPGVSAVSTAAMPLRSGAPNSAMAISKTSPGAALIPSAKDSVAVPK
ncbi:Uncharacterised protein [Acinetobacter baumannii]|nr:Uncharacterised protein [Acinetobacter baumannii]